MKHLVVNHILKLSQMKRCCGYLMTLACAISSTSCASLGGLFGGTTEEEVELAEQGKPEPIDVKNGKSPQKLEKLSETQRKLEELTGQYKLLKMEQETSLQQLQKHEALIMSLQDSLGSAERDALLAARRKRSGLSKLEGFQNKENLQARKIAEFQEKESSKFVPSARDVLSWKSNSENIEPAAGENNFSPNDLYEDANIKFERGAYGEALLSTLKLHSGYPQRPDAGASRLLEAKCYLKIKDFRKAISASTYLRVNYATSALVAPALIVEAEAHKNLREFTLAGKLLKEVISMKSSSPEAKIARAELAKIRDLQTQRMIPEEEGAF